MGNEGAPHSATKSRNAISKHVGFSKGLTTTKVGLTSRRKAMGTSMTITCEQFQLSPNQTLMTGADPTQGWSPQVMMNSNETIGVAIPLSYAGISLGSTFYPGVWTEDRHLATTTGGSVGLIFPEVSLRWLQIP